MREGSKGFEIINICIQLVYICLYILFFIPQMRSWGVGGGDAWGGFALVFFAWFLSVNAIFLFLQLIFTTIKKKKITFLIHTICLYGFNFYWEIHFAIKDDIFSFWFLYIPLFVIVCYLVYDYLLSEITGGRESSILHRIIIPKIKRWIVPPTDMEKTSESSNNKTN